MLVHLADWCYRRRRLVLALWVAALVGAFALAAAFGGEYKQNYLQPGSDSQAAQRSHSDSRSCSNVRTFPNRPSRQALPESGERVEGIEPSWPVWKTGTLPLSYTRVARGMWRHCRADSRAISCVRSEFRVYAAGWWQSP